jgi:peptide/nickel transport system permease protein
MRVFLETLGGIWDTDHIQQFQRLLRRCMSACFAVLFQNLGDLSLNGQDRVECCHRVLKDHRDFIPSNLADGLFAEGKQILSLEDDFTRLSFLGLSMPAFISGILGLYIFSVRLGWFPAGGMHTPAAQHSLRDSINHLILPATTLGIMGIAQNMRYMRFSMLEVLNQDYIVTARAKGLRPRVVNYRHALRNALLPVITVIGLSIPQLVAGAVFIETIYSWRGMGTLYLLAVSGRDYPVIMGVNLVFALIVLAANLLTDIAYSVVDPRVRYEG